VEIEVVLELVDVHEAGEGDAVLLEDHVLLVEVDALDDGTEGVPSLGEGETLDSRTWLWCSDGYQLLSTGEQWTLRHIIIRIMGTVVSTGKQSAALVHPREVLGPALREGAASLILVWREAPRHPFPRSRHRR
jgi:hypothetical protein